MFRFLTTSSVIAVLAGLAAADTAKDPTTAPELAQLATAMTGTWRCKGVGPGRDMKPVEMTATSTWSVELRGGWLHESFDGTVGNTPHVYEAYSTFDAGAKKWKRVMVTGAGGWNSGEAPAGGCAAPPNGCKLDWEVTMHTAQGDFLVKDHVDSTDPRAGVRGWGELSRDHGKTWMKAYDLVCKK